MKLGRNDPCHCGSGKKYKSCHLRADENVRAAELAEAAAKAKAAADALAAEDPAAAEAALAASAKSDTARLDKARSTGKPALSAPAAKVARRRGVA